MSAGRVPGARGTPADAAGARNIYLAKGLALAGLGSDPIIFWDDFERGIAGALNGWNFLTGTVAGSQTNKSCVHFSTGVVAGTVSIFEQTTNGAALGLAANSDKWYLALRQAALTATFNSTSLVGAGLCNKARNSSLICGVTGNLANFGVQYDGNFAPATRLDLGKVLDTAFHIYEMWHPGDGKLHARIDGGADVSVTLGSPPTTLYPITYCFNGSAGVDHQNDIDWIVGAFPRT